MGSPPTAAPNAGGVGKNCSFPWWCTGRAICGDINNFGGSRSLMITVTVQLTATRLVVGTSDDIHGLLQHYMFVTQSIACSLCGSWASYNDVWSEQNYVGSRKKVAVAESAPQADTRSVCIVCITAGQHFNWYRASRGCLGDSWASC